MVLPTDLVLPDPIWFTAAIRWDIFLTEEKVNTSLQYDSFGPAMEKQKSGQQ